jgi:hypothetical protein
VDCALDGSDKVWVVLRLSTNGNSTTEKRSLQGSGDESAEQATTIQQNLAMRQVAVDHGMPASQERSIEEFKRLSITS